MSHSVSNETQSYQTQLAYARQPNTKILHVFILSLGAAQDLMQAKANVNNQSRILKTH
jgi:hypothetical protein